MPNEYQADLQSTTGRYALVVSRYNDSITLPLRDGALRTLAEHGVRDQDLDVAYVPGAFELPLVASMMAGSGRYRAVLALGAVIRGETSHDQHINRAVSLSLAQASLATGVPILFGLLTCDTLEQAIRRSSGNLGNKGVECALAALEMANLLARLPKSESAA